MTENVTPLFPERRDPLSGLRLPPQNLRAEQALLGALLANNKAYDRCNFLKPEHFADPVNGRIFGLMRDGINAGRLMDGVTLKNTLENSGILEEVGGTQYIADIFGALVGIINAVDYAKVIQDTWMRRQLIDAGERLVHTAFGSDPDLSVSDIAGRAVTEIDVISGAANTGGHSMTIGEASAMALEAMERMMRGGPMPGMTTGFRCFDERLGGLEPGTLTVLAGRPAMGKAQPLDAKVLLENGEWAEMGDLRIGAALASTDGKPSVVSDIFPRGIREVFRVTFSDGRSTRACAEHLWRVRYRDWPEPRVLSTERLAEMLKCKRYCSRLSIDRVFGYFGRSELPLDPYVLGVLLGDGSFRGNTPKLTSADPEIIENVRSRLGDSCTVAKVSGSYAYSVVSGGLSRNPKGCFVSAAWLPPVLEQLGLSKLGGEEKFVPDIYMRASRQDRLDLLRGLMDTDGWAEAHGSARFSSCSRRLSENVRDLVRSLGGLCSITEKKTSYTKDGRRVPGLIAHLCRIRHENAEDFFLLERKRVRAIRGRNSKVSLNVTSIESDGFEETRCIRVTHPDSLYVTDEYTVTHNSALGHRMAINAARAGIGVLEISLEMSGIELGRRALSALSGVPLECIKRGRGTQNQIDTLVAANRVLQRLPIQIEDGSGLTASSIAAKARAAKRKGTGMVLIDHLHIVRPEDVDMRSGPTWAIGRITGAMKRLAKDCSVPVLLLAQLNRGVDGREDKRPTLSDLRASGDIEQDADAVGFVYRPEYYLGSSPERKDTESHSAFTERVNVYDQRKAELAGVAEVIWAKVRDGSPGTDTLKFHGPTTDFREEDA